MLGRLFLGTIVGILPGLGPAATIAMLLPLTFNMSPASGIIMLAGIYYGAKYGGSTTSILLNMPGESSSVVTCLDGYQMARKGRAGAALGIAAIASFIAGTFGVVALMLLAPPIADFALSFCSPEYFALMALGLALVVLLAGHSLVKGLLAMLVGLWLASIGTDLFTSHRVSHSDRRRFSPASTSWSSPSACSRSPKCWRAYMTGRRRRCCRCRRACATCCRAGRN